MPLTCSKNPSPSTRRARRTTPQHPRAHQLLAFFENHSLSSSSISTTHGGSWLTLTGVPVSQASELLSASHQLYPLAGTNDTTVLRAIGYALPAVLRTHMQTIAQTSYFASTRTPRRRSVRAAAALAKGDVERARDSAAEMRPVQLSLTTPTIS